MKGLLIKDFKIIFGNVKMIVMLICISIFLMCVQEEDMFAFIISYMTIITSMFVLSTISYDDFDHGMAFLMTLPVTRRIYVTEKYCFGLLCGAIGWTFAFVLCLIFGAFSGTGVVTTDFIIGCILIYVILMFMLTIMIPVQLKFGGDNGKIVIFIAIGACFAIGLLVDKIATSRGIDLSARLDQLLLTSINYIVPGIVISAVCSLAISFMISLKIMKNKQL